MTMVHAAISNALLLVLVVCLGWAVLGAVTGRGVAPGLRSTWVLTLGLATAQVAIGLLLVAAFGRPFSGLHALYGLSVMASLAGAYVYGGRQPPAREALIYALVALFTVGLVLRAVETAGVAAGG